MSFACLLFGILMFFPKTDAGELTWKEPPPIQTVPDNNIVDHFSKKELSEGNINATLKWHFALTGLSFDSLTILFGGQAIAGARLSAQAPVPGYENKYGINWVASQNLVTLFIFNVTTEVDGIFTCRVDADKGILSFPFSSIIEVDVVAPPSNIITSSDQTLKAPTELTLNCSADGKPKPTITWTRVSDNTVVYMPLTITRGRNEESYRCTADNGVGQNLTKVVNVAILYPPSNIMTSSDQTITAPTELTLNCSANGNPKPTITWKRVSDNTVVYMPLTITGGKNEESYRCTADNGVGKPLTKVVNITFLCTCSTTTTSTTVLDGEASSSSIPGTPIPGQLMISADYIEEYKDLDSSSSIIFVAEFVEAMKRRCVHFPWYMGIKVTKLSRGSVIVEFILYIETAKPEENQLEKLKAAISANGTFGRYKAGDLVLLSDESTTSTTSVTSGSPKATEFNTGAVVKQPWKELKGATWLQLWRKLMT